MSGQSISLLSRYQGCLTGAVFGDCVGAELERVWMAIPVQEVTKYVEEIRAKVNAGDGGKGFVLHTDDTCMTFDLGESLVRLECFDPHDVVKRFTETYGASSHQRFYGGDVVRVFRKCKESDFTCDPFGPASEQFDGSGSYGNGSAMRVSPVALFAHGDLNEITNLAKLQSKLTHSHPHGIDGAVLQALAINKVIGLKKIVDTAKFCKELVEQLKTMSEYPNEVGIYEEKMDLVVKLLKLGREVTIEEVEEIGTGVTAPEATPAAIFCFLYTLDRARVQKLTGYNGFVRAVTFAAAVSRDSDTIASMVGAIAGAYYGFEKIPSECMTACEGAEKALKMANDLYEINMKKNIKSS